MSEITASFIVISTILTTIVVGTFVGNLFVITAILRDKNLQTTANQLVLSLAVADLMVACLVMPLGAYNDLHQGWYLGKEICEFWTSADVLCCTASILNLLAIALDRYWAVTNVDYIYRRTRRRVNTMILCVWTIGAVVSLAPIFGWKDPEFADRVLVEHKCMVSQDVAYQVFATISTFYAPLVLLLALYWRIFQVARKRIHRKPGRAIAATATGGGPNGKLMSGPAAALEAAPNSRGRPDGEMERKGLAGLQLKANLKTIRPGFARANLGGQVGNHLGLADELLAARGKGPEDAKQSEGRTNNTDSPTGATADSYLQSPASSDDRKNDDNNSNNKISGTGEPGPPATDCCANSKPLGDFGSDKRNGQLFSPAQAARRQHAKLGSQNCHADVGQMSLSMGEDQSNLCQFNEKSTNLCPPKVGNVEASSSETSEASGGGTAGDRSGSSSRSQSCSRSSESQGPCSGRSSDAADGGSSGTSVAGALGNAGDRVVGLDVANELLRASEELAILGLRNGFAGYSVGHGEDDNRGRPDDASTAPFGRLNGNRLHSSSGGGGRPSRTRPCSHAVSGCSGPQKPAALASDAGRAPSCTMANDELWGDSMKHEAEKMNDNDNNNEHEALKLDPGPTSEGMGQTVARLAAPDCSRRDPAKVGAVSCRADRWSFVPVEGTEAVQLGRQQQTATTVEAHNDAAQLCKKTVKGSQEDLGGPRNGREEDFCSYCCCSRGHQRGGQPSDFQVGGRPADEATSCGQCLAEQTAAARINDARRVIERAAGQINTANTSDKIDDRDEDGNSYCGALVERPVGPPRETIAAASGDRDATRSLNCRHGRHPKLLNRPNRGSEMGSDRKGLEPNLGPRYSASRLDGMGSDCWPSNGPVGSVSMSSSVSSSYSLECMIQQAPGAGPNQSACRAKFVAHNSESNDNDVYLEQYDDGEGDDDDEASLSASFPPPIELAHATATKSSRTPTLTTRTSQQQSVPLEPLEVAALLQLNDGSKEFSSAPNQVASLEIQPHALRPVQLSASPSLAVSSQPNIPGERHKVWPAAQPTLSRRQDSPGGERPDEQFQASKSRVIIMSPPESSVIGSELDLHQRNATRSLDLRRKFRALGQLVSFVQTSKNFNSSSSAAESSQSASEEPESDSRAGTGSPAGAEEDKRDGDTTRGDGLVGWASDEQPKGGQRVGLERSDENSTDGRHQTAHLVRKRGDPTCSGQSPSAAQSYRRRSSLHHLRQVTPAPGPSSAGSTSAALAHGQSSARRRANLDIKREKKAAKTLAIITGVFVCCWLPFFLNAIIMPICGPSCTPSDLILSILLWLGYLNSLLNPIIYTIFSPDFRLAFRRLLCWPALATSAAAR